MGVCCVFFFILNSCVSQTDEKWFPLKWNDDFSASVIDADSYLDAPAGKHGYVQMNQDKLLFEDGTPIKFWGVNIHTRNPFTSNANADKWTKYLVKYGINAVRLHKFIRGLTWKRKKNDDFNPALLDSFDYFHARLRNAGIYVAWSGIWGFFPNNGDSSTLLAYKEIASSGKTGLPSLAGSTIALVNTATDLQNLSIGAVTGMLNHTNPYTGVKYANDPALACIELQNEDDIFYSTTKKKIEECPTYKKKFCEHYSDWLYKKYGSQKKLEKAWGNDVFNVWSECPENESLAKRNIYPVADHKIFSTSELKKEKNRKIAKRLLDNAIFLYEMADNYYKRFADSIYKTGYKGLIISSNWHAGDNIAHFLNLYNDYQIGMIDRHVYAGAKNYVFKNEKFKNDAMVSNPGSGILSIGIQQVINHPFSVSEWFSRSPNEWNAESSPIMAFYGMGLQGWDASFCFSSNQSGFNSNVLNNYKNVHNADAPNMLGLFPLLARSIYRNDIKEGDIIGTRKIHIPSLLSGYVGISLDIIKKNKGTTTKGVEYEALAVGRAGVEFTSVFVENTPLDLSQYWDKDKKTIISNTGELFWNYSDKGYFTINAPKTKGFVGFKSKDPINLSGLEINLQTNFGIVLLTSLEDNKTLNETKSILVCTMARIKNSGMVISGDELVDQGESPLLIEPVIVELKFNKRACFKVNILDHVGKRSGKTLNSDMNKIILDGRVTKTYYYEIIF